MEPRRETRLIWARDIELLHFGLEGRPFHPEPSRGTPRPAEPPVTLLEDSCDVGALDPPERRSSAVLLARKILQGDGETRAGRENHGPLDQVRELSDVSGPWIEPHGVQRLLGDHLDAPLHLPGEARDE